MPEKNFYEVLNVTPQADIDTIKRAYRQLMRQHHPDKFTADIARLQAQGNTKSAALERKLQQSQKQAQRLNEAYAVLSDESKRKAYDQKLSDDRMAAYYAELRRERGLDPDAGRRTIKTRRHRRAGTPPPKVGALPWILFIALIIVAILLFSFVTRVISPNFGSSFTHVPHNPTAVGIITSSELQATQDDINRTTVARTQRADDPTITPLSPEQYERTADRLLERGLVTQAIDTYGRAILYAPDNAELYYKRGYAYTILYYDGDVDVGNAALADFGVAIAIDNTFADAYLERGTVYFVLWQQTSDIALAQAALIDLETYSSLVENVADSVKAALIVLRENVRE